MITSSRQTARMTYRRRRKAMARTHIALRERYVKVFPAILFQDQAALKVMTAFTANLFQNKTALKVGSPVSTGVHRGALSGVIIDYEANALNVQSSSSGTRNSRSRGMCPKTQQFRQ